MEDETELTGFDEIAKYESRAQVNEEAFSQIAEDEQEYRRSLGPTNTGTLLTALASMDERKNPVTQMNADLLESSRNLLAMGEEDTLRYQLAGKQHRKELEGLAKVRKQLDRPGFDKSAIQALEGAYTRLREDDYRTRAKLAIEREAIDRIQDMAVRNPTQAKVLLDNLEKGDANQTIRDFNIRLAVLRQRAEELDAEYQQQGWGKTIMNFMLNLIPLNYNFARSGVVGEGSIGQFLRPGNAMAEDNFELFNMPMEDFAKYTAKDGPFMEGVRSNATTIFDMTYDPAMAIDILDSITNQTDLDQLTNNVWGGVEIASVVPWARLGRASRLLVSSGAPADAARNLSNALTELEARGAASVERVTGITPEELADELSVSAITTRPRGEVPMSAQVATHQEAADAALRELFDPPATFRFNSQEELAAAFETIQDDLLMRYGRPIKDFTIKQELLPGGQQVHYVEFIFGKKDGHGFATELAARQSAKAAGIADGEVISMFGPARPKQIPTMSPGERFGIYDRVMNFLRDKEATKIPTDLKKYIVKDGDSFSATTEFKTDIARPLREFAAGKSRNKEFDTREMLDEARLTANPEGVANDVSESWVDDLGQEAYDEAVVSWNEMWRDLDPFTKKRLKDDPDEAGGLWQDWLRQAKEHQDEANRLPPVESPQEAIARGQDWNDYQKMVNANDNFQEVFQDMSGQYFVRGRVNINDTQFLTNELHPGSAGFLGRMFGRWVRSAARLSDPALHGRALEAGTYINRAHKVIQGNIMGTFSALPKASQEVLKQIGLKGQNMEKWFNQDEFSFLVERMMGRPATAAEFEAYSKLRLYNDMDWRLRNTSMYLNKIMQGKETVKFETRWGASIEGDWKVDYALDSVPTERVYDASKNVHYTKQFNPLSRDRLKHMGGQGYVLVHLDEPMVFPDGTRVNKVLIKKHEVEIGPLKTEQLPYTEGGHRMYANNVFVKQGRKGKQPDTGTEYLLSPNTLRTSANIAEAKQWAETMNRARLAMKENPGISPVELDEIFKHDYKAFPTGDEFIKMVDDETINLDHPFEAVWDREMPELYRQSGPDISRLLDEDELGINGYYRTTGRMYTSSKGDILRNTKGEVAETLDPYDTLSTSLEQVTRQLGLQNYKIEAMRRFRNTYEKYLDVQPNMRYDSQILQEAKVRPDIPPELKNQIEGQREAILNVVRFETPQDKMARQMWNRTAEWVIGDGSNAARKFAYDSINWWRDRNPIGAIRGMVFDMKLGMLNPGQLLIQISTMVSATAMSPKYGMHGMSGLYPMHRYLLSRGNENILNTFAKRGVHKVMGFKTAEEFKDYARHLQTHGFADMNGSHIMINDYGPTSHFGSFGQKVEKARDAGRIFFYTAETWNRLVAYRIAWGETIDAGLKTTDMNFTAEVLRRADDYSFNMTSESAAWWQKGVFSIPTQFWAYNLRMMDAMLGKRFTPAQRIRLATAQLGIAGSAGIPGLGALSAYLKEEHGAVPDPDSLAGLADRGLIDFINYQMTGNDILIGERLGTGGWVTDTVKALFGTTEYGERSFMDIAGGASYSIGKKAAEVGGGFLGALADYAAAESGSDMGEKGILGEKFINLFKEISTFSNVNKAVLIHNYGVYKSNKGTVLIDDLPSTNAAYVALSFRPAKADEIGALMAWEKNRDENIKEISTQLRNWRQEAITNPDKFDENMQKANALMKLIPPHERSKVIRQTNTITDPSFYAHIERKVREEQAMEESMKGLQE